MATIRKRNNKYQVQVRIQGLARSATLISLQHARQWARRKELELESLVKLGELYRPKNFKEILLQYKQKVTSLKNFLMMKILDWQVCPFFSWCSIRH